MVYKSKYADILKETEAGSSKEKKHHKDKDREKKKKKKDKDRDRHRDEKERHKHKHKDKDRERDKEKHRDKDKDREKEKLREREREKEREREIMRKREEQRLENEKKTRDDDEKHKSVAHKRIDEVKRERSKSVDKKEPPEKVRKVLKDVDNVSRLSSEDDWEPPAVVVTAPVKPVKDKAAAGVKRKASKEDREVNKKRKNRQVRDSSDESDVEVDLTPRQCHHIDCINTARVGSKYCSDQCGLSLASLRIYQTLPERLREWNLTSCAAAETNQRELVRIREEINTARDKLQEVDREVEKLEQLITKVKKISPIEKDSDDSSDDDEDEKRGGTVPCISCGKYISSKIAIRHMETCFNKFESQTSYGSFYKTRIEGYDMVCDFYNPQAGTYCKRLRAICPEHTKDPKIGDNEVCGYPLTK